MKVLSITEKLIDDRQRSNKFGVGQVLQSIRQKNDHEIDIYTRCIERLRQRWNKIVRRMFVETKFILFK